MNESPTCAWIVGATGLVGGHCLRFLLADARISQVISIGRRAIPVESPKLTQVQQPIDQLDGLPSPTHLFCSLGTTIKKAGSRKAFHKVDHDLVVAFARQGQQAGARTFVGVSALGADPHSRIFYNRVKGEAEQSVNALGIETTIWLRPSLLLGDREEVRPAERMGIALARLSAPIFRGPLAPYGAIESEAVGRSMIEAAMSLGKGDHVIANDEIRRLR